MASQLLKCLAKKAAMYNDEDLSQDMMATARLEIHAAVCCNILHALFHCCFHLFFNIIVNAAGGPFAPTSQFAS